MIRITDHTSGPLFENSFFPSVNPFCVNAHDNVADTTGGQCVSHENQNASVHSGLGHTVYVQSVVVNRFFNLKSICLARSKLSAAKC